MLHFFQYNSIFIFSSVFFFENVKLDFAMTLKEQKLRKLVSAKYQTKKIAKISTQEIRRRFIRES